MRHMAVLRAAFGAARVLGGVALLATQLDDNGDIVGLNDSASLTIGQQDGQRTPAVERTREGQPVPLPGLQRRDQHAGPVRVRTARILLHLHPLGSARPRTAQQLGGALGIAILGTVFFARTGAHLNEAFAATAPIAAGAYGLAALLCLALPKTAVKDEDVIAAG
ncbi:MAG TPA: hypothetical protein VHZ03_00900 [Trebonia sp.]|jgi:hypothetical protein|nr:hypothetical protein [Trebonia sp.]